MAAAPRMHGSVDRSWSAIVVGDMGQTSWVAKYQDKETGKRVEIPFFDDKRGLSVDTMQVRGGDPITFTLVTEPVPHATDVTFVPQSARVLYMEEGGTSGTMALDNDKEKFTFFASDVQGLPEGSPVTEGDVLEFKLVVSHGQAKRRLAKEITRLKTKQQIIDEQPAVKPLRKYIPLRLRRKMAEEAKAKAEAEKNGTSSSSSAATDEAASKAAGGDENDKPAPIREYTRMAKGPDKVDSVGFAMGRGKRIA